MSTYFVPDPDRWSRESGQYIITTPACCHRADNPAEKTGIKNQTCTSKNLIANKLIHNEKSFK